VDLYFIDLSLLIERIMYSINSFNLEIIGLVDWIAIVVRIIFLISIIVLYT